MRGRVFANKMELDHHAHQNPATDIGARRRTGCDSDERCVTRLDGEEEMSGHGNEKLEVK